jgi:hypothetical protein
MSLCTLFPGKRAQLVVGFLLTPEQIRDPPTLLFLSED